MNARTLLPRLLSCLCGSILLGATPATAVTLDFSSGTYNNPTGASGLYLEDDFRVSASSGFHKTYGTYGPTLAWYDSWTTIRVEYTLGTFDLHSVLVPMPPYAGLVFNSSKGGQQTYGSVTGTLSFSGPQWSDMDYVTIHSMTNFSILTELDNFTLTPREQIVQTPLPHTLLLLASGLATLAGATRKNKSRKA